jgi:hypothetical protein
MTGWMVENRLPVRLISVMKEARIARLLFQKNRLGLRLSDPPG